MANELEKVIEIDGTDYEIHAVEATKVECPFTVKNIGFSNDVKKSETVVFDGAEPKEISIVSATTGGKFMSAIRVPSINDEGSANKTKSGIHKEAVLNYEDIVSNVVDKLINTSSMATWTDDGLVFTNSDGSINGISLVYGKEDDFSRFEIVNKDAAANDNDSKWLAAYLYICSDTGNLYFGTCELDRKGEAIYDHARLASSAEKLDSGLCDDHKIMVDLERNTPAYLDKDSLTTYSRIEPGVNGKLQPKNGGTGQDDLSKVTVGRANLATSLVGVSGGRALSAQDIINTQDEIGKIVNGTTKVKKAEAADTSTKAQQDTEGKPIHLNYYRSTLNVQNTNAIYISTSEPSSPSVGDIWIKY